MPLGQREGVATCSRFCGVETHFNNSMKHILDTNIHIGGGFDYVVVPLISPTYRPSLVQQFGSFSLEASRPFAKSDFDPVPYQWNIHVAGKISEWIDLDSPDEMLRKDSETAFKQELAWASYLSLRACILPTPKGDTWTNYARCANQFLQEHPKDMQLWLRIPLGKPDDDSKTLQTPDGYWKMWNSFRLLSDHNSKLFVALDNLSTMPSDNSLNHWYGEPVAAFIIHTDSFFTRDGDNPKHLSEGIQKLITYFLNHYSQIIISENQLSCSKDEEYHLDTDSAADSRIHRLLPYIDHVRSIYQQMDPLSEQERSQVAFRDVLLPNFQPFKEISQSMVYNEQEKDEKKYIEYKRAICQALLDRVPDEKASVITTVLVVVGAGRGALVRTSLQAANETGRKLKVYAVDKNLNALVCLYKQRESMGWNDIVTIIHTDVRHWNAPETADILVSELLGSFGDNELAPEILDGAQRFLKEDGISIPSSYTSFLQPVKSSKLYSAVKAKEQIFAFETAFITKMHNVARLAPSQPLFTFTHPKHSVKESNRRYRKLQFVIPDDPESTMVHGFAGYFDATLYKDVHLGTEPSKATPDLLSWAEMYFPLREPICVHRGSTLEVHFWRCCDSTKVWYEWGVTSPKSSPISNCNACADCVWLN
ncbi:Protein arginine N-methyltransferase 5 [Trifolium repens]|nr:Protein arginine N-methyltransferase 5 [Trifolium repens]